MSLPPEDSTSDPLVAEEGGDYQSVAATYVEEAFAEARHDGLDGDCLAHAALYAAFRELVATYGEDAVAVYAEGLPAKIKSGVYSIGTRH
jgi:predicted YcjX-like family ATPase